MKKRWMALALVLTLTLSLCAVSALAEETADTAAQTGAESAEGSEDQTPTAAEPSADSVPSQDESAETEAEDDASPAGPDPAPEEDPETGEVVETDYTPDAVGRVTFENVERRMRSSNLSILALQETVDMLNSIDYEQMQEDLRKQLNQIAKAQWYMTLMGQGGTLAYEQMDQAYSAVRDQFDAIKDGDTQKDNADVIRQVQNLQDQIVLGGEATYVAVAAMELQEASLQRQLAAMNRTVEEMELRYKLGQISAMQLAEVRAGQSSLSSGLETLRMNIATYKMQLKSLLGAELTGELQLGTVPAVTQKQLAEMDVEADLQSAKSRSYELYDAGKTYDDAQEDYKDAGDRYGYSEKELGFRQAKHTWQAAQFTYNNTVQDYERRFRVLYAQVGDYRQILTAAQVSLESEKLKSAASELQYQQGTISYNALLTARDDLAAAESAVKSAENDLFSAYNTYCWAVQHGILNA